MSLREGSNASAVASPWGPGCPFPPLPHDKKIRAEESDEELFTVPDLEATPSSSKGAAPKQSGGGGAGAGGDDAGVPAKVRRGRNPHDREYRRLKRLLRNRVSAQQARERRKVYVNDLELRAKELHDRNSEL